MILMFGSLIPMIELGPATEDQVVCAFLQAEIESSRYKGNITHLLSGFGLPRSIIDAPDLSDITQNRVRRCLLAYRGYPQRLLYSQDFRWTLFGVRLTSKHKTWERCDTSLIRTGMRSQKE